MKYLSIILILLFTLSVSAQEEPCTMKLDEVWAYKGLRLGMTQAEVESAVGSSIKLEPFLLKPFRFNIEFSDEIKNIEVDVGYRTSKFFIPKNNTNESLKEITLIEFHFYNDYLFRFEIKYLPASQPWKSIKEYTDNLSEILNIPLSAWRDMSFPSKPNQWAILRCNGVGASASLQFPPSDIFVGFSIADLIKSAEMNDKAREAAEAIRREKEARKP